MSAQPSIQSDHAVRARYKEMSKAADVLFSPARNEDADRKAVFTRPDRSQSDPSMEWERAEEIAHARLANDDDVSQAICDVFGYSVADRASSRELTSELANRQATLLRLLRDRDFIGFGAELAQAVLSDTIATADEIAHDEWMGDRNFFDPTARAA